MTLIFIVNGHISSITAFSDYVITSNKDAAGKRLEEMGNPPGSAVNTNFPTSICPGRYVNQRCHNSWKMI